VPSSSSLLWLLKLKLTLISTAPHLINSNSSTPHPKDMDNPIKAMPHLSIRMVLLAAEAHPMTPMLKAINRLLTSLNMLLTATRAMATIPNANLRLPLASSGKSDLLSDPAMSLLSMPLPSIPTGNTRVSQTRKLSPPAHSTSSVTLTLKAASSLSRSLTTLLPSLVSSRASSPVFTP